MRTVETPVLVVGGGGCGLSASIFLSNLDVDHFLVERHAATSHLPKAHYLNQRTMEIYRQHGVADAIYEVGAPIEKFGKVRWLTSLGGSGELDRKTIFEMDAFGGGSLRAQYEADGPSLGSNYPQLRLEPLLRREAEARAPGRIGYHHDVIDWRQTDAGLEVTVNDRDADERYLIRCRYLIAADGGKTFGPRPPVELHGMRTGRGSLQAGRSGRRGKSARRSSEVSSRSRSSSPRAAAQRCSSSANRLCSSARSRPPASVRWIRRLRPSRSSCRCSVSPHHTSLSSTGTIRGRSTCSAVASSCRAIPGLFAVTVSAVNWTAVMPNSAKIPIRI